MYWLVIGFVTWGYFRKYFCFIILISTSVSIHKCGNSQQRRYNGRKSSEKGHFLWSPEFHGVRAQRTANGFSSPDDT